MNPVLKIWDTIRLFVKDQFDKVNNTLNTAFPDPLFKYCALAIMGVLEVLLFYLMAVLNLGMWIGVFTPWGMIYEYIVREQGYPWLITIGLGVALLVAGYAYLVMHVNGNTGRGFSLSDSNVYGSAREINEEELKDVAEIRSKEAAMGTILGQLDLTEENLITQKANPNSNGNIAVFGPPGSGKSFCFVKPFILQAIRRGESVICTDTKGELWADTVEFARKHGYVVRRIDLKNPAYSDGWDVLGELRHDDMRALIAAQIIMANTGTDKDIHASAEEALLRAICLYQERNESIPPEEKTLYRAYAMLFEGATALDAKFEEIKYDPDMSAAYDAYASFTQGSPNLRGNIITGLANRLSVLSSPPVREMTSTPDIDLTELGRKPSIFYLVLSDQHETMKFMASLFFSFAFLDLVDFADAQLSRKLPVPVNFLMEEFANLGQIPNITKYLSTCRSRAINISLVIQNLSQLREVYGDNDTNIILADCATHLCIGYNDKDTADYFEWRSGEASINVKTEQHQHGESPINIGRGYSTGDGRRNLFTSHELMTIPAGHIYIVWQRYNCLLAKTFGVNRHPATLMGEMTTISTEVKVRLEDKEAKAYLRAMEEQRVQDYEEWVKNGGNPWEGYTEPQPKYDGPARGTKPPDVIPYPELERMALEHGKQAEANRKDALMRRLHKKPAEAATPEPAVVPEQQDGRFVLPEDFSWDTVPMDTEPLEDSNIEDLDDAYASDMEEEEWEEMIPVAAPEEPELPPVAKTDTGRQKVGKPPEPAPEPQPGDKPPARPRSRRPGNTDVYAPPDGVDMKARLNDAPDESSYKPYEPEAKRRTAKNALEEESGSLEDLFDSFSKY